MAEFSLMRSPARRRDPTGDKDTTTLARPPDTSLATDASDAADASDTPPAAADATRATLATSARSAALTGWTADAPLAALH